MIGPNQNWVGTWTKFINIVRLLVFIWVKKTAELVKIGLVQPLQASIDALNQFSRAGSEPVTVWISELRPDRRPLLLRCRRRLHRRRRRRARQIRRGGKGTGDIQLESLWRKPCLWHLALDIPAKCICAICCLALDGFDLNTVHKLSS